MGEWLPAPVPLQGNYGLPPPVLNFNEYGDLAALLIESPHNVVHRNLVYPTALHLYEAHKFLDNKPEIAEKIRGSPVQWVTTVSGRFADFKRQDWGNIGLGTMDNVLYLKFSQHGHLRKLLLDTHPAELVYANTKDPFWGAGAGIGMNELGKSLMRVRKRLRVEGGI